VRSPLVTLCIVATVNETRLQLYLDAEAKILGGQLVRMGDRQLQRADLAEVRAEIARLQAAVNREQAASAGRGGRFSQADFGGCA
jgi:hypothetical protein